MWTHITFKGWTIVVYVPFLSNDSATLM